MSRALDLADSEKRAIVIEIARRLSENDDPMAVAEEFLAKNLGGRAEPIGDALSDRYESALKILIEEKNADAVRSRMLLYESSLPWSCLKNSPNRP